MPNVHILSFAVSTIRPRKKMRYFILQREYESLQSALLSLAGPHASLVGKAKPIRDDRAIGAREQMFGAK
jgi:hypothetical protein